nr:Conserved hypothetical protein [Methylocystis sp. SC2]
MEMQCRLVSHPARSRNPRPVRRRDPRRQGQPCPHADGGQTGRHGPHCSFCQSMGVSMGRRIVLIDIDRHDEPLTVEVDELRDMVMVVGVPNTQVKFYLQRRDESSWFEGSIGGRYFVFDPTTPGKVE